MFVHRLGTLNIAGLRRKTKNLHHLLFTEKIAILGLQETKIDPNFNFSVSGYNIFRKDHTSRSQGVALLIHNSLPSSLHSLPIHLTHLQAIAVDVHTPTGPITFINYYNHPSNPLQT